MNRLRSGWVLFAPVIGGAGLLSQYVSSTELMLWMMVIAAGFYVIIKAISPILAERSDRRLAMKLQPFVRKKD